MLQMIVSDLLRTIVMFCITSSLLHLVSTAACVPVVGHRKDELIHKNVVMSM